VSSDRIHRRTSDLVDSMSEEARAELARNMTGKPATVPDPAFRRTVRVPPDPGKAGQPDPELEEQVARVTADLQRTERRLYQLERSVTKSRYQMVEGGAPSARAARLESRARRLERRLRALRAAAAE
jgi:hypothetical protein